MLGMVISYEGDAEAPAATWLRKRLKAISVTASSELPEACLELIYSGIDTLGWLGAPVDVKSATRSTFEAWCDGFLVSRLKSVDGIVITAADLYAARCGILHTSRSTSDLSSKGHAREICYRFGTSIGVNFFGTTSLDSVLLDLEHFAISFKEAALEFGNRFAQDLELNSRAQSRANTFFHWGKLVHPPKPASTPPL